MLGERLSDIVGSEGQAGTVEVGLNLLPVETSFASLGEKTTLQCQAQIEVSAAHGLFASLSEQNFYAYQIHLGRTTATRRDEQAGSSGFKTSSGAIDGWLSADGWCAGCYLHGLFENDAFRKGIVDALGKRYSLQLASSDGPTFDRQSEYDKLATLLRAHLNIPQLKVLCDLI